MRKLKCNKNWIPWLRNCEGRKIPSLDGNRWAKWSDRSILLSYDEALFLQQSKPGLEGIGFVIPDGYLVIDLDKCIINNGINDQAQRIIDKYQSYTEKSPSGTGIHIIVKSTVEGGKWTEYIDGQSVEYLTSGGFVTFTGDVVVDSDIRTVNIEKPVDKRILCASREIGQLGGVCSIKNKSRYGTTALTGECQKVREAKKNSRTNTLIRSSFKIGQLIVSGYVNEYDAIRDLSIAGMSTGLPKQKVRDTIEDGITHGKQHPR